MRRWAVAAALLIGFAGVACDAGSRSGTGLDQAGGRVVVQRLTRGNTRILDGPAQASYCPDDSLLVVVAIGRQWTGGLAVKVVLPLDQDRTFQVQGAVGGPGTASAAFRPLGSGGAELAIGGAVRLEAERRATGRFEISAPDSGGVHVLYRGRLADVPIHVLPSGSCGS